MTQNKMRGAAFEYAIMHALDAMVQESYGGWGTCIRRREAKGCGQDFDLLFGSSMGSLVVECKSKRLSSATDPASSDAKVYIGQGIRPDQITRQLNVAFGMGFVPVYAIEWDFHDVRGELGKLAYLIHVENLLRILMEYKGITLADAGRWGIGLDRVKKPGERWGYQIRSGQIGDLICDYRSSFGFSVGDSATLQWCRQALDGRRADAVEAADVPNVAAFVERMRRQASVHWVTRYGE